jgi:osmotically-inducible protein OsmY
MMKRFLYTIGLAGCLAALAGCTAQEKAEVRNDAQNAGARAEQGAQNAGTQIERGAKVAGAKIRQAAGEAGQVAEGIGVTARVKARLTTEKGLDHADINVDSVGSSVTLKGTVQSKAQSELAERVASKTEGVEKVTNQLTVVPAGKSPHS